MRPRHARTSAHTPDGVVVFLIGMRIGDVWRLTAWVPVFRAMLRMIRELARDRDLGLLHVESGWMCGGPAFVQYWRSYDDLERYARSGDAEHLPAWRAFNRAARRTDAVGIWHETYRLSAGHVEAVYNHMPAVGLLAATGAMPIGSASTSASRLAESARCPVEHD